jgi:uncharacterized protein with PIN domain
MIPVQEMDGCPFCKTPLPPPHEDPVALGWVEVRLVVFTAWLCPECARAGMGGVQLLQRGLELARKR